jgi:hypothetical protein
MYHFRWEDNILIDKLRMLLLVGIANQTIGDLPPFMDPSWVDYLYDLVIFLSPQENSYAAICNAVGTELSILINGHESPGYVRGGDNPNPPIKDAKLLDTIGESLLNLDGMVGLVLAANPYISENLREQLTSSTFRNMGRSTYDACVDSWVSSQFMWDT